jgi:prepilin-type N-terminal cleavage/methylation domain-containing protein
VRRLRVLRRRAAGERAFTLIEMIIVLAILGTIVSALTAVFVSALHTEVDQNKRFEAQQNARLALVKLRREIHCAKTATVQPGGATVTVTSAFSAATENPYCRTGTSSWCVLPDGSSFSLYRQAAATCDATGVRTAQYLVSNQVFELLYPAGSRAKVHVDLRVDRDTADVTPPYRLFDDIVLLGSPRA